MDIESMIRLFIAAIALWCSLAHAGLPPTSLKGANDAGQVTTFFTQTPWINQTHTGVNSSYTSMTSPLFVQVATPATPAVNTNLLWFGTDDLLHSMDSTGTVVSYQPAGNYITALTGDVTATGPGSVPATIAQSPITRYVDLIAGNDANSGTYLHPWKTMQQACTTVSTLTSFNEPWTIHVAGGTGNDTDVGTVTCPPNVAYVADNLTQLTGNWVISTTGGGVNDNLTVENLIFIGSFTWSRNDIYFVTLNINNSVFGGGLTFKQAGSGAASIQAVQGDFVGADLQLNNAGSFFNSCQFLGATTFEDVTTNAYYQFMGGYMGTPISIAGGPYAYFGGVVADVPYGYTLTTSTTANGTPVIQTDDGSVPPTISGPNTLYLASFAQHVSYTPSVPGNWSPPPIQVASALDQLAARTAAAGTVTSVTATQPLYSTNPTTTPNITMSYSGSLITVAGSLQLAGDAAAPSGFYYGTGPSSAAKGFYVLPTAPSGSTGTVTMVTAAQPLYVTNPSTDPNITVSYQASIVTSSGALQLSGDVASPGDFFSYATNAVGTKGWFAEFLPLSGGTMSGAINMGGFQINNLANPTSAQDAATKNYVDNAIVIYQAGTAITITGNVISGAYTAGTGMSISGAAISISNQVSAGSCTNCNVTFNAQGQATAYASGSSGGGGGGSSTGSYQVQSTNYSASSVDTGLIGIGPLTFTIPDCTNIPTHTWFVSNMITTGGIVSIQASGANTFTDGITFGNTTYQLTDPGSNVNLDCTGGNTIYVRQ